MTAGPWWRGLAPVDAAGPEAADGHRLRWEDGALLLLDHPDPDADRALGALGGERCPCLDVLDAWEATHEDGAVLTVAPRGPDDVIAAAGPAPAVAALQADLRRWRSTSGSLVEEARLSRDTHAIDRLVAVAGPAEAAAARRLGFLLLLALEPPLLHRLQASVAAALPSSSPALVAATAARVVPVLRGIGWQGGRGDVRLGDGWSLDGDREVRLPGTWLASVWGRGLADAVPDHLVVDVTDVTDDGGYEVVAVAPGKPEMAVRVAPVGE